MIVDTEGAGFGAAPTTTKKTVKPAKAKAVKVETSAASPDPVIPAAAAKPPAVDPLVARIEHLEQWTSALPSVLDLTLNRAVEDAVRNHGHLLANAIMPHAGALVREGMVQTAWGIIMTPVYVGRWLLGVVPKKADDSQAAPAATPALA